MKLHSPRFEKALRRRVRRTVRSSPALKHESRLAKRFRRPSIARFLVRPAFSAGLAFLVWRVAERTQHPLSGLAVISLWTFALIFIHAQGLWSRLFGSTDLPALSLLPLPETTVFRWELQKFLRGSLMSLVDLLAGFGALAVFLNFSPARWSAVLAIGALTWVLLLALAALCAARLPTWLHPIIATGTFFGVIAVAAVGKIFGWEIVFAAMDRSASTLNLLLPTGWAVSLFSLCMADPPWLNLGLLVPVAAITCTVQDSLSRLRSHYRFEEMTSPEAPDQVPEDLAQVRPSDNTSRHLGLTEIEEIVRSRLFLAPPAWSREGWFERMFWRWCSAREKALAEMIFPNRLTITARWKNIFRCLGVAVLLGFAAGAMAATLKLWLIAAGILVSFCLMLGQILDSGRTFQPMLCNGVNIPLYAGFPVGLRELSRLLLKVSAVQIPPLLAGAVICGMLTTHLMGLPATDGIFYGLRAACLMFACRLILIVVSLSSGTNDTASFRFRTAALIFCILALGGLFLALGAAGLLMPRQKTAWIITAFAMLDAYVLFRIYGWFYHRNNFDLMSLPRE